ncbi:hypothetical protein GCM10022226_20430 [Sphaerisporangium flaviroseum]|uniref:WD40 repeat domain-containing protein n=1 Tax=Sphaerisporangium flaviroseum TaxID=509199 RepID=A0ABP7HRV1_9ACTN
MTRLKDMLGEIAAQGPAIGDVADRAIGGARRHRRRLLLLPALAVVASIAVAVALARLPTTDKDMVPAMRPEVTKTITLPSRTPAALPSGAVPPALLAYTSPCELVPEPKWRDCAQWRLLTVDGRHFRVPDAIAPEIRNGMVENDGALAIAPDGRMIAYFDEAGRLLVHDLATGEVRTAFTVERAVLSTVTAHIAWAPDARRLAVGFEPLDDARPARQPAMLVDLATTRATELPGHCCVLGLGAGDALIPMYDAYANTMGSGHLRLVADDGTVRKQVSMAGVELQSVYAQSPGNTAMSPDGRRLAALIWPQGPGRVHERAPDLRIIDAHQGSMGEGRSYPQFRQAMAEARLMGWRDSSTVLVGMMWERLGIYAVRTDTGEVDQLIRFTNRPDRLSVATALL